MNIKTLLANNRKWAFSIKRKNPNFFSKLSHLQKPDFFWIGCSDSRVPANEIIGLLPGDLFVHRNVANMVYFNYRNCLSALYYAIEVLKVKYVIVCGHYVCGGVKAVIESKRLGPVGSWLKDIRAILKRHLPEIKMLKTKPQCIDRLCELNVLQQAENLCKIKFVRDALRKRRLKGVYAWVYSLRDGLIRELKTYK